MNANNLESLKAASLASPLMTLGSGQAGPSAVGQAASSSSNANRNIRDIPEDNEMMANSDLPPTLKLLVYLWDEIKSYCIQVCIFKLLLLHLDLYSADIAVIVLQNLFSTSYNSVRTDNFD